jgi:hypothetical protein
MRVSGNFIDLTLGSIKGSMFKVGVRRVGVGFRAELPGMGQAVLWEFPDTLG